MRARWVTLSLLVACKPKTPPVDEPVPVQSPPVVLADAARSIHGLEWGRRDVVPSAIPSAPVAGLFRGTSASPLVIEVVDWKGPDYEQHEVHFYFTQPPKLCAFDQYTPGFKIGFSGSITPGRSANTAITLVHATGAPFAVVLWDESATTIGMEGSGWLSATVDATSRDEVRGRIYAWFDDPSRSMIAGAFVAKACNISPMNPAK